MFKATTKEPDVLIGLISTVAEIIDEGVFKLTKKGIELKAADRAMVAVVDLSIAAEAFEEYKLDKDQEIGLNITNLLSVLKRGSGAGKLSLELEENKLKITIQNSSKRRFAIPLLDITQEEIPPVDQLDYKTHVTLKPEILKSGIEDASIITDAVTFHVDGKKFSMVAEGDVSKSELELEKGEEGLVELKTEGATRARYPLEYLKKMIKAARVADTVHLHFSQDYPMRLEFKYGDKARLSFVLAPRVVEE